MTQQFSDQPWLRDPTILMPNMTSADLLINVKRLWLTLADDEVLHVLFGAVGAPHSIQCIL